MYLSYSGPALSGGSELGGGESLAHGGLWTLSSGMTWAISGGGSTWAGFPYSGLGALEEASPGGARGSLSWWQWHLEEPDPAVAVLGGPLPMPNTSGSGEKPLSRTTRPITPTKAVLLVAPRSYSRKSEDLFCVVQGKGI